MGTLEVGQAMVQAVNGGRESEWQFVLDYYADNIVSIEGAESGEMPARMDGMDAIKGKHEWWFANNEVHDTTAEGPFIGLRDNQFILRFSMDITPTGGERIQMTETAIYTVADDKIVQEEYFYLMA